MATDQEVQIALRLLEFAALLLPVIAIFFQALILTLAESEQDFGMVTIGVFAGFFLAILFLGSATTSLIDFLETAGVSTELQDILVNIGAGIGALEIAALGFAYLVYRRMRPGDNIGDQIDEIQDDQRD